MANFASRSGLVLLTFCVLGLSSVAFGQTAAPEPAKSHLTLTIEGSIDAELAPVAGRLTTLFYECYPKLLYRFENPANPPAGTCDSCSGPI
jgi:hypothetical protein